MYVKKRKLDYVMHIYFMIFFRCSEIEWKLLYFVIEIESSFTSTIHVMICAETELYLAIIQRHRTSTLLTYAHILISIAINWKILYFQYFFQSEYAKDGNKCCRMDLKYISDDYYNYN